MNALNQVLKSYKQKITKNIKYKIMQNNLILGVKFPLHKKDYGQIEK